MRRAATLLVYLATGAAVFGFGKVHADQIGHYEFTGTSRFTWLIAYAGLLLVSAYAAGIPEVPRDRRGAVLSAIGGTAAAALGISLVQLAMGSALLPRYVVFWSVLVLTPAYAICSLLALGGRGRDEHKDRVLAVVSGDEAAALERDLTDWPEHPAVLAGVLAPAVASRSSGDQPVVEAALDADATVIVLDRDAQADESIVAQAATLHERGLRIRTLSLFYEEWLGKLPVSELERVALLFDIGELHRARYARVKRIVDLILAIAALPVLVLAVVGVAIVNLFANRGPLFHRQERVGRGEIRFVILKFRTMRPGSDHSTWTSFDDPRVTTGGRMLRRTHIDELPQLVNVLRGHLSVVGPRPEQPRYVEELNQKIPFYRLRHLVRPGLTGWAQVKYGYAGSESDALEKLQYEMYYLRRQSLGFDARIIGRTVRNLFRLQGV